MYHEADTGLGTGMKQSIEGLAEGITRNRAIATEKIPDDCLPGKYRQSCGLHLGQNQFGREIAITKEERPKHGKR